jgi:hypothetical protein
MKSEHEVSYLSPHPYNIVKQVIPNITIVPDRKGSHYRCEHEIHTPYACVDEFLVMHPNDTNDAFTWYHEMAHSIMGGMRLKCGTSTAYYREWFNNRVTIVMGFRRILNRTFLRTEEAAADRVALMLGWSTRTESNAATNRLGPDFRDYAPTSGRSKHYAFVQSMRTLNWIRKKFPNYAI